MLENMYHIGVFGMSWCGKSNFIARLFQHFYLHKIDPTEIYIFSPSFNTDVTYAPIWHYLQRHLKETYNDHVKLRPDLEVIKDIMKQQEKAMILNDQARYWQVYGGQFPEGVYAGSKEDITNSWGLITDPASMQTEILPIKWYVILIDDCLSYLKSYQSDISLVGTWSWHREITIIWVAQIYKRLPSSIWAMLDVSVLFYMYPLSDTAFDELFNKKDLELFRIFYKKNIQDGAPFSFIIIDKRAKWDGGDSAILYEDGESKKRMFIVV